MNKRLVSLDAFRGITIAGMILVNNPGSWSNVYPPLLHAEWHGWTPTDLIFPFFLFIVGVAITLSFQKQLSSHDKKYVYLKILRRTLILFGLGYSWQDSPISIWIKFEFREYYSGSPWSISLLPLSL